ncbi:sugar ABC transporter permease [Acrocarpospora macrocephala]|uniref:ABC transporter permease n=1 Tax=Acrocarpospora macrocephala TaxID=150177 RepID=A0A5M3WZY5_9ACTN|nr:ABC transporter permease subunit [Acrocarpospora macrocephala]GES14464.1 ABC transporter permease [Acrocarpospora macrocephala]
MNPTKAGTSARRGRFAVVLLFPALGLLAALVLYPVGYSLVRSLLDAGGQWTGLGNYLRLFTDSGTFTALRNNLVWVIVAPTLVTVVGLMFAVLTERVRFATAFKTVVFMPIAISFLASGVIFRMVYDQDPEKGIVNAVLVGLHDTFAPPSGYPDARPRPGEELSVIAGALTTTGTHAPGAPAALPLVGVKAGDVPASASQAAAPPPGSGLAGTVWLDFASGGGGREGVIDPGEKGLPGISVEAVIGDRVAATAMTRSDGTFRFAGLTSGGFRLRLPEANFAQPYAGVTWLGPGLVTPSIIAAYLWIYAGFAMVLIAAGLAAIPRDSLEAARIDGASEWQVFRRITVPLLAPVLGVVFVTLVINVLKIFDLVYILAPGSVQSNATVLALQLWNVSFGGGNDQGMGSAIGIVLFVLVLPAMLFNLRRFRREQR